MFKKLAVLFVFISLSIYFSGILRINPQEELIGEHGDKYEFFAFQYLVRENFKRGMHPLARTDIMRYPVGFEFGHGYDGVLATFTGGLLGFVVPEILAYNITIIFILFLNLSLTYLFLGTLQKLVLARLVGSIVFGLSFYALARINGHPNLLFVGGFPLFFYFCVRIYKKLQHKDILNFGDLLSLGIGLLVISFGSLQYVIMLIETSFIILFLSIIVNPRATVTFLISTIHYLKFTASRLRLVTVLTAIVVTALLGSFYFGGFLGGLISGSLVYGFDFAHYKECCIPSIFDVFVPNRYLNALWGNFNQTVPSIERVISLGIAELLLLFAILLSIRRKIGILLCVFFVTYILLSVNIIRLPYLPEGGRSVVLLSLLLSSLIAQTNIVRKKWVMLSVFVLMILERLPTTVHSYQQLVEKKAVDVIRNSPGKAVLNIPLSKYNPTRSFGPYLFGKKIVDGYFHDTADNPLSSSFLEGEFMQRYICDGEKPKKDVLSYYPTHRIDTIKLLKYYDIRTIVIYKDSKYEKFLYDNCLNVRYWWYSISPDTLIFDKPTTGSKSIELVHQPRLKTMLHFSHSGRYILEGLYISPNVYIDTKIVRSDNKIIQIPATYFGDGLRSKFIKPIVLDVKSGEWIELVSDKLTEKTIYITVYYSYEPDLNSVRKDPEILKTYASSSVDIYQIQ